MHGISSRIRPGKNERNRLINSRRRHSERFPHPDRRAPTMNRRRLPSIYVCACPYPVYMALSLRDVRPTRNDSRSTEHKDESHHPTPSRSGPVTSSVPRLRSRVSSVHPIRRLRPLRLSAGVRPPQSKAQDHSTAENLISDGGPIPSVRQAFGRLPIRKSRLTTNVDALAGRNQPRLIGWMARRRRASVTAPGDGLLRRKFSGSVRIPDVVR